MSIQTIGEDYRVQIHDYQESFEFGGFFVHLIQMYLVFVLKLRHHLLYH